MVKRSASSGSSGVLAVTLLETKDLSPLAKKVQQPKDTGDKIADGQAMQEYNQLVVLIDTMCKQSKYISPLHSHLVSLLRQESKADSQEGVFKDASTILKLDADWVIGWIAKHSKVPIERLAKVKQCDPSGLAMIMQFALQIPKSAKLPEELRVKAVCDKVFSDRHGQVGKRLAPLTSDFVNDKGEIEWKFGCFSFRFHEAQATICRHCSGEEVKLPSFVTITQAFVFKDNHDDGLAQVSLQGCKYSLKAFFERPNAGPNAYATWGPRVTWLKAAASDAHTAMANQNQRPAAPAPAEDTSADLVAKELDKAAKDAQKKSAGRARKAFQQHQETLQKQRRVKL